MAAICPRIPAADGAEVFMDGEYLRHAYTPQHKSIRFFAHRRNLSLRPRAVHVPSNPERTGEKEWTGCPDRQNGFRRSLRCCILSGFQAEGMHFRRRGSRHVRMEPPEHAHTDAKWGWSRVRLGRGKRLWVWAPAGESCWTEVASLYASGELPALARVGGAPSSVVHRGPLPGLSGVFYLKRFLARGWRDRALRGPCATGAGRASLRQPGSAFLACAA
jgi:hypothetical protein